MATVTALPEVKRFQIGIGFWIAFFVMIAVGAFGLYLLSMESSIRAWYNYLIGATMFLGFGLCGLFLILIGNVVNAHWHIVVRRVFEAMAMTLPIAAIMFSVVYVGMHHIYEWAHEGITETDHLIALKSPYLNSSFFMIRLIVCFSIWLISMLFVVRNSLRQDESGDVSLTLRNRAASAFFLVLFGLTVTTAAVDVLKSLEPHWFSTIYGVYFFACFFQAGLAAIYLITFVLDQGGFLKGYVNKKHFHDIGKYVFAFSVFWAYIGFSQFMLIWYADLPEETFWYQVRLNNGWEWIGLAVFAIRWALPFLVLLPYGSKTNFKIAVPVCVLILFGNWLDLFWNAMPASRLMEHAAGHGEESHFGAGFGWQEFAVALGFMGLFFLAFGIILQRIRLVPIRDPRLMESIHHH